MFKVLIIAALVAIIATLMNGCVNRGNTVDIGEIETYEYNGKCQTMVATPTHKLIIDGNHAFRQGTKASLVTYEQKDTKIVRLLMIPDLHDFYIVRTVDSKAVE